MKSNKNYLPLKTFPSIENYWKRGNEYNLRPNTMLYYTLPESDLYDDGWRNVVVPQYDSSTQKLGDLEYDSVNDVVTYPVIDLADAEIQANIQIQADADRMLKMQIETEKETESRFQAIADDNEALDNQSIFPIWSTLDDGFGFTLGYKVQGFEGNELKLFRCIQEHDKQSDWNPILVPALWTKIEFSGGVEVWSQPTGGDEKYPEINPDTGQKYLVTHNSKTWENIHTGGLNVWEPGVFGWNEIV